MWQGIKVITLPWEAITAICAIISLIGALAIYVLNLSVTNQLSQFSLKMEQTLDKFKSESQQRVMSLDRRLMQIEQRVAAGYGKH